MEPIWFRLEGLTRAPEQAVGAIWSAGAAGVEIQDQSTYMEGGGIKPVPDGLTRVIAFFESEKDTREQPEISGLEGVDWARFDDRTWETAWKAYFKPVLLAPSIMVGPPWETFEAPEGGLKVVIQPGMAFGTGTHETTQLCATELAKTFQTRQGDRVLDVGCGSAILSICCRKLGSGAVTGIDITDDVMDNALENIGLNGVDSIELSIQPLADVTQTYPIVIANILAHILEDLRDELVAHVESGGLLLMSGLTESQESGFRKHFEAASLQLVSRTQADEWICLVYRKP